MYIKKCFSQNYVVFPPIYVRLWETALSTNIKPEISDVHVFLLKEKLGGTNPLYSGLTFFSCQVNWKQVYHEKSLRTKLGQFLVEDELNSIDELQLNVHYCTSLLFFFLQSVLLYLLWQEILLYMLILNTHNFQINTNVDVFTGIKKASSKETLYYCSDYFRMKRWGIGLNLKLSHNKIMESSSFMKKSPIQSPLNAQSQTSK